MRTALGASPWQIALDLGGETLLLTGCGAALAMLFALWCRHAQRRRQLSGREPARALRRRPLGLCLLGCGRRGRHAGVRRAARAHRRRRRRRRGAEGFDARRDGRRVEPAAAAGADRRRACAGDRPHGVGVDADAKRDCAPRRRARHHGGRRHDGAGGAERAALRGSRTDGADRRRDRRTARSIAFGRCRRARELHAAVIDPRRNSGRRRGRAAAVARPQVVGALFRDQPELLARRRRPPARRPRLHCRRRCRARGRGDRERTFRATVLGRSECPRSTRAARLRSEQGVLDPARAATC